MTMQYSLQTPSMPTIEALALGQGGAPALAPAAPGLLASAPGWVNPALTGVGILGSGIGAYMQMKEAERQRKIAERQLALQEAAQRFEQQVYKEAAPQRAVNLSASAIPVANMRTGWNERLALLRNSVGIK